MFKLIKYFINNLNLRRTLYVAFDSGGRHKPTIILLHGIAATSQTWGSLIKELDVSKYRIVSMDLLGFGESPKPVNCEYSVVDHVKYIRRTIKKLRIRGPYKIVGHSMGSIIAARYCLDYPRNVQELYLLSLPLYFKDEDLHNMISRRHTDLFLNVYDFISHKKKFTISSSQKIRKLLGIIDGIEVNEENWNGFRLSLRNTIIKQNTYHDIKDLNIPVNIIYGLMDQFMVQENIAKLSTFENIKIIKLNFVDHSIGSRFAKKVAEIIS